MYMGKIINPHVMCTHTTPQIIIILHTVQYYKRHSNNKQILHDVTTVLYCTVLLLSVKYSELNN
jgi:hypothetical protein